MTVPLEDYLRVIARSPDLAAAERASIQRALNAIAPESAIFNSHNREWSDPTAAVADRNLRRDSALANLLLTAVSAFLADNRHSSDKRTVTRVAKWLGLSAAQASGVIDCVAERDARPLRGGRDD